MCPLLSFSEPQPETGDKVCFTVCSLPWESAAAQTPTRGQLTEENLWNRKLEWIFPSLSFSGILPWWCQPAQVSQYLTLGCDRRVQVSDLSTLKEHTIYYNTKILLQWELYVNTLISLHRHIALNIRLFFGNTFYRFNIVQKPIEIKSSHV